MKSRIANGFIGALLLPGLVSMVLLATPLGESIRLYAHDLLHLASGPVEPAAEVVIVAIDDPSFKELGRPWPWPRSFHADLIEALHRAGAAIVLFDVLFVNPAADPEQDRRLATAIRRAGNVILASATTRVERKNFVQNLAIEPTAQLAEAARMVASANLFPAMDGVIREGFLRVFDRPGLAFAAVSRVEERSADGPVAHPSRFRIRFTGPAGSYPTVSFYQALAPDDYLPPNFFRDRIVLVGHAAKAAVTMQKTVDALPTPYFRASRQLMHGVEIHANIIDNLLNGRMLTVEPLYPVPFLVTLLALLTVYRMADRPLALYGLSGIFILGFLAVSLFLFQHWNRIFDGIVPAAVIATASLWWGGVSYFHNVRQKQRIKQAFVRYLPEDLVGEVLNNPEARALGGRKKRLTILFSDIRGFTTLSERFEQPEMLVDFLNDYLDIMTERIHQHQGIIDKYIGDAIMALFGAPLPRPNHPELACRAALAMKGALKTVDDRWRPQLAALGFDGIGIGIGLNCGEMVVGNIGSRKRFDYTVIGDAVNLAARLEGLSKVYGVVIVISDSVRELIGAGFITRELDRVRVKGKESFTVIHELMAEKSADAGLHQLIDTFHRGLTAYRQQRWDEAGTIFGELLQKHGDDGPSRLYLQRCSQLKQHPPEPDWDGVWRMTDK